MNPEKITIEAGSYSVFEQLPLHTKTHWRPIYDFVDAVEPNNALIDVRILPFSSYRPSENMIKNGYIDPEGFQHVFYSLLNGFEEGIDTREDHKVRKGSTVDIFSRARRGDVELMGSYVELNPERSDRKQLKVSYLIYRYMSGALDDLYFLNDEDEVLSLSSDAIKKKTDLLREWLSKPKKEISNYNHTRSIGIGMLNEIWLTDVFNYFLKVNEIEDYEFIPAPYVLDASEPGANNGGDILLTRKRGYERESVTLIDAKLRRHSKISMIGTYNKYTDSPRIAMPVGNLDLYIEGHKVNPTQYLRNVRNNISDYDWDNPLMGMNEDQRSEFFVGLKNLFNYSIEGVRWMNGPNNLYSNKLMYLEDLMERLPT